MVDQVVGDPYNHDRKWYVRVSVREDGDDVHSAQEETRADLIHKFGGRTEPCTPEIFASFSNICGTQVHSLKSNKSRICARARYLAHRLPLACSVKGDVRVTWRAGLSSANPRLETRKGKATDTGDTKSTSANAYAGGEGSVRYLRGPIRTSRY